MNATKCDRCQKYYDNEIGMIAYKNVNSQDSYQRLDICPECLEAFKKFIRSGEARHE